MSHVRSADGGMPARTSWSETSSVSVPSELRQPCEAPLRRHGPGAGRVGATIFFVFFTLAGTPPREPTVGPRAGTRARPC